MGYYFSFWIFLTTFSVFISEGLSYNGFSLKRKFEDREFITGYVVKVEDVRTSTATLASPKGCRYFVFHIQTGNSIYQRCVSFSPNEHRHVILRAQQEEVPISFPTNSNGTGQDIKLSSRCEIKTCSHNALAFKFVPLEEKNISLAELDNIPDFSTVNVHFSVHRQAGDIERNIKGNLTLRSYVIVDSTGHAKLSTFDEELQEGTSYHGEQLSVRSFQDKKHLSTKPTTKLRKTEAIKVMNVPNDALEDAQKQITEVISCSFQMTYNCPGCKTVLNIDSTVKFVKCTSCLMKCRRDKTEKCMSGSIILGVAGKEERKFVVNKRVVVKTCESFNLPKDCDAEELEDKLLEEENVNVAITNGQISSIEPIPDDKAIENN